MPPTPREGNDMVISDVCVELGIMPKEDPTSCFALADNPLVELLVPPLAIENRLKGYGYASALFRSDAMTSTTQSEHEHFESDVVGCNPFDCFFDGIEIGKK
jgi:hypothetical protein